MKEESTSMLLNNLYLSSNGILIHLSVDDISMSYPEAATKATIEVKAKLSEKYKITNLGPACQFLGIEIHCEDNGIRLDPNIKLDLAEDRRLPSGLSFSLSYQDFLPRMNIKPSRNVSYI